MNLHRKDVNVDSYAFTNSPIINFKIGKKVEYLKNGIAPF